MTLSPHTIEAAATYAEAGHRMRELRIRHLPVLDGATLVGMVTDDDVSFMAALKGVFPESVRVGDVRAAPPYTTTPDTELVEVARDLIENKRSCATVLEKGKVVGVFTLVDALRALVDFAGDPQR